MDISISGDVNTFETALSHSGIAGSEPTHATILTSSFDITAMLLMYQGIPATTDIGYVLAAIKSCTAQLSFELGSDLHSRIRASS